MTANPPILLLDTCVWLDLYLLDRPDKRMAQKLIRYALDHNVPLAFSSHSGLDVYAKAGMSVKRYFREGGELTEAQAKAAKSYAWDCVSEMCEIATVVPADSSDYYLASKYLDMHDDFEDALILAACARSKANYLVTRDLKLLQRASIATATPKDMLFLLENGLAAGTPTAHPERDATYYLRTWLENSVEA